MTVPGGRLLPVAALATVAAVTALLLFGAGGRPPVGDAGTSEGVAGLTVPPPGPSGRPPSGPVSTAPGFEPGAGPTEPPVEPTSSAPAPTGIVPGAADRTSLDLRATYDVNAAITVATGALDVSTTIVLENTGTESIDRVELNTVAARLGRLKIGSTSVDERPVKARIDDQTIVVPLGGVLQPGATATVLISYRATLRDDLTGSDWMLTRAGGTLALYRWIPWLSRAVPFDRPNEGEPFVTVSSPEVSVELLLDRRLVLAAPAADVVEYAAGSGVAWSFTLHDVRDVSVVLAPDFAVAERKVGDVTVRAYARSGGLAADRLLSLTTAALRIERDLVGVDYPWPALVAVETQGGEAIESPGLIWIPRNLDTLNREYLVHHTVAHQWFYGLVGNDQRNQPFADEAVADLIARTALGSFRPTRCSIAALDRSIARYTGRCYYEVLYVQGGLLLDEVRRRMGSKPFWAALQSYAEAHRFGIATTRDLLDALQAGTDVNLKPLLRGRFPSLF